MAVQTIILRPNGNNYVSEEMSWFPDTTADDKLYLLINEEVADDDATYIGLKGSVIVGIEVGFPWGLIEGLNLLGMRAVFRQKSTSTSNYVDYSILNSGSTLGEQKSYNNNVDEYETLTFPIQFFDTVKDRLPELTHKIFFSLTGSNKTSGEIRLSQFYLEVDYDNEAGGGETEETEVLYLKKSGAWESISGKVYNKVNGAWVDGTLDALQADGLVVVQEVV